MKSILGEYMIEDLSEIKKRLKELAEILNGFNSEAVQLRILDFVLEEEFEQAESKIRRKPKRGKQQKVTLSKTKKSNNLRKPAGKNTKKARKRRIGGYAMMDILLTQGYFEKKKTASEIINYCIRSKATNYKASDFAGKLASLTRDGVLDRKKNNDNQYEYWKK